MKKQLFSILMLAIFAIAFTNSAVGQAVHKNDPQPLTCATGPLSPIAGNSYNYAANVNPAGGTFQWWATTDPNFIAGGTTNIATQLTVGASDLLATSASYGAASATNNVDITWSSGALATAVGTPTFVAVQYGAAPGPGCANNLKVYQIIPVNGFTVDVLNLDPAFASQGYGNPLSTCVSPILSATYSGGNIVTNYGINVLYFEVVAANFTGGFTPNLVLSGLQAGQTATVEWSYDNTFTTTFASGVAATTAAANTSNGVSIYVRVTVANGTYEGLAAVPLTLTVNAVDAVGNPDVVNNAIACGTVSATDDQAIQNLLARPTVTSATAPGFVTP